MAERAMRAMSAIGMVPSAKAGRIMCLTASPSSFQLADRIELKMFIRLMKSDTVKMNVFSVSLRPQIFQNGMVRSPGESRPEGGSWKGVSLSASEKIYASINPSQKTGMETPMLAHNMVTTSTQELCRTAEMTPNGIPMIRLMSRAAKDS